LNRIDEKLDFHFINLMLLKQTVIKKSVHFKRQCKITTFLFNCKEKSQKSIK